MAGTIVVDRIESDASYASSINVAGQITFSNTVNFGVYSGTAPVAGFYLPATNNLAFTTGSTERLRIDNAGNVGIGTNSPAAKLDNTGSFRSTGATDPTSGTGLELSYRSTYGDVLAYNRTSSAFVELQIRGAPIIFGNAGGERMRIDSNGNVGIGVSPSYKLHVQTSDTTNPAGYFYNTSGASNSPALIARGGANNAAAARIISAQDYDGNEEFGISGTGELRVNAGYGSSALGFVCRAWVNFDGTGTVAIRASGNVSSITDLGTGAYTVNLTTAMPDTNYACAMAVRGSSGAGTAVVAVEHAGLAARTTTSVSLYAIALNSATPDTNLIEVMFFR